MASKLKNRLRAEVNKASIDKSSEDRLQPDRRPSTVSDETDEFSSAPNIAAKIAQRRLPRRTPTSHVKGVGGDLIRRRLSKTNDQLGSSSKPRQSTFEEESLEEPGLKPPPPTRQPTEEKPIDTSTSPVPAHSSH